jgi:hypothetical protein
MPGSRSAFVAVVLSFACGPEPPGFGVEKPVVTVDPAAALDHVPPVARLRVRGLGLPPAALALFRGELSDYYESELRNGKVPTSLRERQVAGQAWFDAEVAETVFAPSVALSPGESHTLAVLGSKPLATLRVADDTTVPYVPRVWPPHEWPRGGGRWVFCGDGHDVPPRFAADFEPGDIPAIANPGADSQGMLGARCFRIEPEENPGSGFGVPPTRLAGVALDPGSVGFEPPSPVASGSCSRDEVNLGPACARVFDDRALLHGFAEPLLLALDIGGSAAIHVLLPGAPIVVTGLAPSARVSARGTATDVAGREAPFSIDLVTTGSSPHVVLNEVLANPIGAEPSQEWIELVNDGGMVVDLGGMTLELSDGRMALSRGPLAPGAFALVVSENYDVASGSDVAPAPGTLVVRLPRLGLSNSGESLTLRAADGTVLSRFPAVSAPSAGISVGRRVPSAPDADPRSFGIHRGRGASPGWSNDIAAP